jgi:bacillithiol system protein YtxJ
MEWKVIRDENELKEILRRSETLPQVIFKHSTRCSISSVAKNRLERSSAPSGADFYYLDIISYRSISNKVAEVFKVHHESPQVLVIKNGECMYDESHMGIGMWEIEEAVKREE